MVRLPRRCRPDMCMYAHASCLHTTADKLLTRGRASMTILCVGIMWPWCVFLWPWVLARALTDSFVNNPEFWRKEVEVNSYPWAFRQDMQCNDISRIGGKAWLEEGKKDFAWCISQQSHWNPGRPGVRFNEVLLALVELGHPRCWH